MKITEEQIAEIFGCDTLYANKIIASLKMNLPIQGATPKQMYEGYKFINENIKKTAEEILQKVYDEHEPVTNVMDNEEWEMVCLKSMNEFANQFNTKLFEFVYCGMTEESSYATMSVHRTREGAEKAMNEHKEKARQEWKKKYPIGSYEPFPFGRFEDWGINEIEVQD